VQKGALVSVDPFNPLAAITVFQYNPDTISRTLAPQTGGAQGGAAAAPGEPLRLTGPPLETMKFDIILDAADQLETGDKTAQDHGILPQLAALEMLLYPKSAYVIANEALLLAGVIEVIPPSAPLTVLVMGVNRVLPVRLSEFSITEELHDPALNPIHAKVSLGVRVLTYRDLGLLSAGGGIFMAHQVLKEVLATKAGIGSAGTMLQSAGIL
jgi:hypothetical protein